MFYVLSKLIFFLIAPSNVAWLLIVAGLLAAAFTARQRTGFALCVSGTVLMLVLGFSPLGNLLSWPLEQRFARPGVSPSERLKSLGRIDAIIVLGGFENGRISRSRGLLSLNHSAERMSETVRLAHQLPNAKIIFTGGVGGIFLKFANAAQSVKRTLSESGIAPERIIVESRSRNTWENAAFTKPLIKPVKGKRYLLVTSAWHMPRAVGVFRKLGYDIVAWPVDFRTAGASDLARPMSHLWVGLERCDITVKEYIGLLAYWLTGRSSSLFPAPRNDI